VVLGPPVLDARHDVQERHRSAGLAGRSRRVPPSSSRWIALRRGCGRSV